LEGLHSQHEPREKIFAVNLYLCKKAKNAGCVRAKAEGKFGAAARLSICDERTDRMQVQDAAEVIAKTDEMPERAHNDLKFVTWLTIGLGDAQLASNSIPFADQLFLE
jgi:hypothetical protein